MASVYIVTVDYPGGRQFRTVLLQGKDVQRVAEEMMKEVLAAKAWAAGSKVEKLMVPTIAFCRAVVGSNYDPNVSSLAFLGDGTTVRVERHVTPDSESVA